MSKPSYYLECLNRDGFVLIPSILTSSEITTLRTACKQTIDLARSGNWPYVRTIPKQFPPWNTEPGANPAAGGIWGVQACDSQPCIPIFVHCFKHDISAKTTTEASRWNHDYLSTQFLRAYAKSSTVPHAPRPPKLQALHLKLLLRRRHQRCRTASGMLRRRSSHGAFQSPYPT